MHSEPGHLPARLIAGIDAALVAIALGVMYALIAYAALGPAALPVALLAAATALVVGGSVAALTGSGRLLVSGATASGTLVVAGMVRELQTVAGARGQIEPVLFAVAVVVAICGALQLVFARLRVGAALKFVPFPVLAGFANTVALSLVVAMTPAALGQDFPGRLIEIGRWFPGWRPGATLVAATATLAGFAAMRWWPRAPAAFVALLVGAASHYGLQAAGLAASLGPTLPIGASWLPVAPDLGRLGGTPLLGATFWGVVLTSAVVLGVLNSIFSLLTAARLASPLDPPVDGNRLLRSQGLGNLAAACAAGLPVAVLGPATVPMRAAPGPARLPMIVYTVLVAAAFTAGHGLLATLPMAAVAGAVFVAARSLFDASTPGLLRQALRSGERRAEAAGPLAIVALVVLVGLLQGLAAALFVGALAAACLLAIELRRGVVLGVADGRSRRSRRVRTGPEARGLDDLGERVRVVELGHWLYFGTADELGAVLDLEAASARWLVLDVRRVAGVDVTAARSLVNAAQRLGARGVRLVVAGFAQGDDRRRNIELFAGRDGTPPVTIVGDIDEALERAEDELLGAAASAAPLADGLPLPGMGATVRARLLQHCEELQLQAGSILFRAGDAGDALYAVRSGRMSLRVARPGQLSLRLLAFGPGVIFGEMALLDGCARSADAVAELPTTLLVLRRDRFERLAADDAGLYTQVLHGLSLHLVHRLRDTTALLGERA